MIVLLPVVLRGIFCASAVEFLKGIYTAILHDPWWTTMIVGVEIHFPDVLGLFPLFRIIAYIMWIFHQQAGRPRIFFTVDLWESNLNCITESQWKCRPLEIDVL